MHHVNIPFRIQFPQVICWLVVASFSSCCPWRKLGGDGVHPLEGDPRSETAIEIMGNMWGKWWLTINMLAFFPTCSDKPGFVTSLGHNLKKSCPGLCNNDGKMGVPPPKKKTKRQFHGKQICSAPWDFGVFPTFSDVAEGEQFLVHDWEHPGKSRSCRGCNSKWLALENQRRHGKPTIHDKMCGETMAFRKFVGK